MTLHHHLTISKVLTQGVHLHLLLEVVMGILSLVTLFLVTSVHAQSVAMRIYNALFFHFLATVPHAFGECSLESTVLLLIAASLIGSVSTLRKSLILSATS